MWIVTDHKIPFGFPAHDTAFCGSYYDTDTGILYVLTVADKPKSLMGCSVILHVRSANATSNEYADPGFKMYDSDAAAFWNQLSNIKYKSGGPDKKVEDLQKKLKDALKVRLGKGSENDTLETED
jgi:hypothetical protein